VTASADLPVALVSTDLWLQSRVAALARGAGTALCVVARPPVPGAAALVLVDCNERQEERVALIAGLVAEAPGRRVAAILPHKDVQTQAAARAAGACRCVPNSALATVLPRMMRPGPVGEAGAPAVRLGVRSTP